MLLLMAGLPATVAAEEVALLAGVTDAQGSESYSWGMEYRQRLFAHVDASLGYLNEGHLPGHHRDGGMLQLWADTGFWHDRFALSVGAGPYVYFDTEYHNNFQGYLNQHGVGLILSGRLNYSLAGGWFALLEVNQVVSANPGTRTVMLGAGYRLDRLLPGLDPSRPGDLSTGVADVANEIGLFAGQTTLNNLSSNKSTDFGIEFRHRATGHLELSATVLDESSGAFGRHAGIIGQAWMVKDFFSRQLSAGLGIGPYAAFSAYQTSDGRSGASVVGMASLTCSWRFTRSFAARLSWNRGFTGDDQDRDIVTAGVGWRF
jgi:hypothetical protein